MLSSVKYKVVVSYLSFLGEEKEKEYIFFARDDTDARNIASELFLLDEGVSSEMQIFVTPIIPDVVDEHRIDMELVSVLREIEKLFQNITYPEFMEMFIKFSGRDLELGQNPSYTIDFLGFTMRLSMVNKKCVVDRSEITYRDNNNHLYIIRGGIVYCGN